MKFFIWENFLKIWFELKLVFRYLTTPTFSKIKITNWTHLQLCWTLKWCSVSSAADWFQLKKISKFITDPKENFISFDISIENPVESKIEDWYFRSLPASALWNKRDLWTIRMLEIWSQSSIGLVARKIDSMS